MSAVSCNDWKKEPNIIQGAEDGKEKDMNII
jgi:hypothetical protein